MKKNLFQKEFFFIGFDFFYIKFFKNFDFILKIYIQKDFQNVFNFYRNDEKKI